MSLLNSLIFKPAADLSGSIGNAVGSLQRLGAGHLLGASTTAPIIDSADAAKRAAGNASIANSQKAIDSLDTELGTGYRNIDDQTNAISSQYDKEAGRTAQDYNDNIVTNNQNFIKNKQSALQAGAQGAAGLRSTLASIGALGGDGLKLANRAVTAGVNDDIGGATDTAATNTTSLNKAFTRFKDEDKDRRDELSTSRNNQRTALEGSIDSKRQDYLQKIASVFGDLGDGGSASRYLNMAGDLNMPIAQKTAVAATPLTSRAATYDPGALSSYLGGNGDMTVAVTGDNGSTGITNPNSILATRKRDDKRLVTA